MLLAFWSSILKPVKPPAVAASEAAASAPHPCREAEATAAAMEEVDTTAALAGGWVFLSSSRFLALAEAACLAS